MHSDDTIPPGRVFTLSARALSFFSLALVAAMLVTAGQIAQSLDMLFGILFVEIAVFFGVSWRAVRLSGRDPVGYACLNRGSLKTALLGFGLGATNYFAVVIPLQFIFQQHAPQWMKDWSYDQSEIFKNRSAPAILAIVAMVAIAAPFCEEYFFRGVFQRGLGNTWQGLVFTALIFSAAHLDAIGFVARAELGLLFGFLFWRTASLWPGIAAHAANNIVSTFIYFWAAEYETEMVSPKTIALVAGLGGMALVALSLAGRRWLPNRDPWEPGL